MEKQTVLFATMAALFIATPHALGSGVEILSPNGGEELAGLSTFPITWQCDPNVITVDIEFSDSNGLSWSVIASDTPNDGQYDWLVPSISSDECLVRVGYLSPCDTKVVDVSDGVFAVQSFAIPLDPCTSKFVAFDGSAEDYFGMSISVSGDTCIIGSPGDGNGSVHVYRFDGKSWMFEQKLVASDGSRKFGDYGSVSISGDVCAVGGGGEKVFIYRFDGISWVEEQKLTLYSSGEYYDIVTVAIDGDVCVTRASERCMEECSQDSVQIFRFTGSSWVRETVLTPFTFPEHEFEYGWALSVNNDVCAIASRNWDGSVNHVDMFRFNGSSWIEENSLNAPPGQSWSWDFQGLSVSGNVCVVGDQHDDENGSNAGAAYVFRFDGVEWVYETKLLASDGVAGDDFGGAVSVDRDVCLVGADNAAYVFRYDGCSWYQDEKLIAPDASAGDNLGYSVSVSGGTFAVGTPYDDDKGTSSGSAYIFSACSSNSPYLIESFSQGLANGVIAWFASGGGTARLVDDNTDPEPSDDNKGLALALDYDDSLGVATVTGLFVCSRDWSLPDRAALKFKFHGHQDNDPEIIGITITDSNDVSHTEYYAPGVGDFEGFNEYLWNGYDNVDISLEPFDVNGVDLSSVQSISISVGDGIGAERGTIYIDTVEIFPTRCLTRKVPGYFEGGDCYADEPNELSALAQRWLAQPYIVDADEPVTSAVIHFTFDGGSYDSIDTFTGVANSHELTRQRGSEPSGGAQSADVPTLPGGAANSDSMRVDGSQRMETDVFNFISTNNATVSVWLKGDQISNQPQIGGKLIKQRVFQIKAESSNSYWKMEAPSSSGKIAVSGSGVDNVNDDMEPNDFESNWNHVAYVHDFDNNRNVLYLNGIMVEEGSDFARFPASITNLRLPNSGNNTYRGLIDEFRLYDYALTHRQVVYLTSQTSVVQPVPSNGADTNDDGKYNLEDLSNIAQVWHEVIWWP